MTEKEIEALRQIRNSLVSFGKDLFGEMQVDLNGKMFEVGFVDVYHTKLRQLERLGHNIKPRMVPNEAINPPRIPVSDEELLFMLQEMQKEGKQFSQDDTEYHFVEARVLKEKLDEAIAYIDSCFPKPSKVIGFQRTPVL